MMHDFEENLQAIQKVVNVEVSAAINAADDGDRWERTAVPWFEIRRLARLGHKMETRYPEILEQIRVLEQEAAKCV